MVQAGMGTSFRRIFISSTCVTVQSLQGLGLTPSSFSFRAALSKHLQVQNVQNQDVEIGVSYKLDARKSDKWLPEIFTVGNLAAALYGRSFAWKLIQSHELAAVERSVSLSKGSNEDLCYPGEGASTG